MKEEGREGKGGKEGRREKEGLGGRGREGESEGDSILKQQMTNGYDKCIAQMKLTNTVKLHFSHDNQCAHVIQPHKATVVTAHGTANLADIFIGKKYTSYNHTIGPAKVFWRRTSLYQFLN